MITPKQFIVGLFCIAIIAFAFLSRPELPACPKFGYWVAQSDSGSFLVLDMENAKKLGELVKGLSEGTCKI